MTVIFIAAIDNQASLNQHIAIVICEYLAQTIPSVRRITYPVFGSDLASQPASFQIIDRRSCATQLLSIEITRQCHGIGKCECFCLQFSALRRRQAIFLLGHRHAHVLRQIFHRLDKTQSRILHQKTYRSAVRTTTKAVIKLLGRTDRKAGRFFVMKGAEATEIRATFLELHVATHHVDDVNAVQKILNETLRDHVTDSGFTW